MQLSIQLYAKARDLAGSNRITVQLDDAATIAQLRTALATQHPALAKLVPSLLVAIGTEYATDATVLTSNSSVSCFPPVSGG